MTELPAGLVLLKQVKREFKAKKKSHPLDYVIEQLGKCCEEHKGKCKHEGYCTELCDNMDDNGFWTDGSKGRHVHADSRGTTCRLEVSDWLDAHLCLDRISRQVIY